MKTCSPHVQFVEIKNEREMMIKKKRMDFWIHIMSWKAAERTERRMRREKKYNVK